MLKLGYRPQWRREVERDCVLTLAQHRLNVEVPAAEHVIRTARVLAVYLQTADGVEPLTD